MKEPPPAIVFLVFLLVFLYLFIAVWSTFR